MKAKYNFPCTDEQRHLAGFKEKQSSDKSAGDKNRLKIPLQTLH
jgi:hypothetical protein